jgi:hypothetical protein
MVLIRRWAFSLPTCFTPKSSMTSENCVGHVVCFQSPGVCVVGM